MDAHTRRSYFTGRARPRARGWVRLRRDSPGSAEAASSERRPVASGVRRGLQSVAILLLVSGCWTEVFLPAEIDGNTSGGDAVEGCDGDADLTRCRGDCVDVERDPDHCGECGETCASDERCVQGECEFACDCDPIREVCDGEACVCRPGTERCGNECVALQIDATHCGECGHACDDVCLDYECAPDCFGLLDCNGDCTDPEIDPFNCGACGRACDGDQVCAFGECRDAEPVPFACQACPCEGFCEDLDAGFLCCDSWFGGRPICVDTPLCAE